MTTKQLALTDLETLDEVINCLTENFNIETQGATNQQNIFEILVRAASIGDSIENTSKVLNESPCGNDIRYHLDKIDDFEQVEQQTNSALKSRIPQRIKKGRHKIAIDLNLIPYYGKPNSDEEDYIYRSEAKSGTNSFYAYATVYVLTRNKRVTLAIRGVRWYDTSVAIITHLLGSLSNLNIDIKTLYLDRGFFNVPVIRWLKALKIPFIMPAIRRGNKKGIKQFLNGRSSYKTTYTMSRGKDDDVTFDLWIVCKYRKGKGKRKKRGVEYFAYVVFDVKINLTYVHEDYRKRFGIESSYRLKNLCRIRTNNKKPALRLLFVGISFILVNIWVYLLWFKISRARKGRRLVYSKLFGLKQMLSFLRQTVEEKYKTARNVYIPIPSD
ncbi:ISH3 family transposase [Dulcicalothrix desertica PCC 7102]|uniref:ISH3 family transposase n=1 Tax=Dulcicalothrix desertica PCC 7102 TaxID=232991 RepID=A0A3S1AK71_9CYAN|nr:ISH3 family transposase [Dulcicalothrix desertica]RUS93956.1 ISH3 family transposase [Dulcicalothrix desertica PCC 7102]TWH62721.1 putative transposase [Dulcicalothrix desertica PCC 7102]